MWCPPWQLVYRVCGAFCLFFSCSVGVQLTVCTRTYCAGGHGHGCGRQSSAVMWIVLPSVMSAHRVDCPPSPLAAIPDKPPLPLPYITPPPPFPIIGMIPTPFSSSH